MVDRRGVVTPSQARKLLTAMTLCRPSSLAGQALRACRGSCHARPSRLLRFLSGIAFDSTGRFGHRLLVAAGSGGRTTVLASAVTVGCPPSPLARRPSREGSPWRQRPSADSAATLSPRTRPAAGCTPWTQPGTSSPWRRLPSRSLLGGQQAPRRQRHLAAVRGTTGAGRNPGRRPAHRHRRRRQGHRHPLHGRVHHPVRCHRTGDRARRRARCLRIVVKTPNDSAVRFTAIDTP